MKTSPPIVHVMFENICPSPAKQREHFSRVSKPKIEAAGKKGGSAVIGIGICNASAEFTSIKHEFC